MGLSEESAKKKKEKEDTSVSVDTILLLVGMGVCTLIIVCVIAISAAALAKDQESLVRKVLTGREQPKGDPGPLGIVCKGAEGLPGYGRDGPPRRPPTDDEVERAVRKVFQERSK